MRIFNILKSVICIILVFLLIGCSGGNSVNLTNEMDKPIAQIILENIVGTNYLFEIYSDGRMRSTSMDIGFSLSFATREVTEQIEILLSQQQLDRLSNAITNFINEDMTGIKLQASDPSFFFCITAIYRDEIRELEGQFFVSLFENDNDIQTKMADTLMTILKEVSPISIVFIEQPF